MSGKPSSRLLWKQTGMLSSSESLLPPEAILHLAARGDIIIRPPGKHPQGVITPRVRGNTDSVDLSEHQADVSELSATKNITTGALSGRARIFSKPQWTQRVFEGKTTEHPHLWVLPLKSISQGYDFPVRSLGGCWMPGRPHRGNRSGRCCTDGAIMQPEMYSYGETT